MPKKRNVMKLPKKRDIRNRTHCTTCGQSNTLKSPVPLQSESVGEYLFTFLMEFTTRVVSITHQPATIRIQQGERSFSYTPDFLTEHDDGSTTFHEVKDARYLNNTKLVERYEHIKRHFEKTGQDFQLHTDVEVTSNEDLITNLQHLKRYRGTAVRQMSPVDEGMVPSLPMTLGEMKATLGYHTTYRLIAESLVWCDLKKPLSEHTVVENMEGHTHEFLIQARSQDNN